MELLKGFQGICRDVILLKEELNESEIALYSEADIELNTVPEKYGVPNSEVMTDIIGDYNNIIPYGYPYGGELIYQTSITAGNIYKCYMDNKSIMAVANTTKNWGAGTSIPDSSFSIINHSSMIKHPVG